MRKIINIIAAIIFIAMNYSCQHRTEKRLIGMWSLDIDSCIVYDRPWFMDFAENSFIIDSNQECSLPSLWGQARNESQGDWQLLHKRNVPDSIVFKVPNNPLNGKYAVCFYKDYNEMMFKMKLQNDSTLLIGSKHILSFTLTPKELLDRQ